MEILERDNRTGYQIRCTSTANGVGGMDYQLGLGVALGGAVFSLLTSIATVKLGATGSPSAID